MVKGEVLQTTERYPQATELLSRESQINKLAKSEFRDIEGEVFVVEPKGTLYLTSDRGVVVNPLFRSVLNVLARNNSLVFFNLKGNEQTAANLEQDFPGVPVVNKPEWRNLLFDIATGGPNPNIAEMGNFIRINERIDYLLNPDSLGRFFWNTYIPEKKTRDQYSKSLLPALEMKGVGESRRGSNWTTSADDFLPPLGIVITPSTVTGKSYENALRYYCHPVGDKAFEETAALIKNIKKKTEN